LLVAALLAAVCAQLDANGFYRERTKPFGCALPCAAPLVGTDAPELGYKNQGQHTGNLEPLAGIHGSLLAMPGVGDKDLFTFFHPGGPMNIKIMLSPYASSGTRLLNPGLFLFDRNGKPLYAANSNGASTDAELDILSPMPKGAYRLAVVKAGDPLAQSPTNQGNRPKDALNNLMWTGATAFATTPPNGAAYLAGPQGPLDRWTNIENPSSPKYYLVNFLSTALADPHMRGLRGQKFNFNPEVDGGVYNFLQTAETLVNARIGRVTTSPKNKTFIVEIGVRIGLETIRVTLNSVEINGKAVQQHGAVQLEQSCASVLVMKHLHANKTIIQWAGFNFEFWPVHTGRAAYLDSAFAIPEEIMSQPQAVTGVIGQTVGHQAIDLSERWLVSTTDILALSQPSIFQMKAVPKICPEPVTADNAEDVQEDDA
jgi:hypothetical protein